MFICDIIFYMSTESFSKNELLTLYSKWKVSIEHDQNELKEKFMDDEGNITNVYDPDLNMFAGRIAGKTEFALDLAYFIEQEPIPDTPEEFDKA